MADQSKEIGSNDPFEAAIAAAEAELGQASPDDEPTALPADVLEADDAFDDAGDNAVVGQPDDAVDGDADDFFADEQSEKEDSSQEIAGSTLIEVPKYGPLPLDEVVKGYMRMDHFTQSQQQVKELERQLQEKINADTTGNADLWQALKEDPKGTVAYLAAEVGLMDRETIAQKMRDVPTVKLRPESDVEQMVQERLEQAVRTHPAVQQAITQRVQAQIESQFAEIESRIGRGLSDNDRTKTMNFAAQNGILDLSVAFDALAARRKSSVADGDLKQVRPQRRTAAPAQDAPSFDGAATDFAEAAARALAELEAAGAV